MGAFTLYMQACTGWVMGWSPREGRWMAAVLAWGPDSVLSHYSAAALWMIRPNSRSVIDVTDPVKSRTWDGIAGITKRCPTTRSRRRKGSR